VKNLKKKDLFVCRNLLIFVKQNRTAEWFLFGGSPYSPHLYSSPLYKLEIKVIKTRAVYERGNLGLTV
jgi:hypothetical protein